MDDRFEPGTYRSFDGQEELVVTVDTGQPHVAVTFTHGPRKGRRTGLHRNTLKQDFERVAEEVIR